MSPHDHRSSADKLAAHAFLRRRRRTTPANTCDDVPNTLACTYSSDALEEHRYACPSARSHAGLRPPARKQQRARFLVHSSRACSAARASSSLAARHRSPRWLLPARGGLAAHQHLDASVMSSAPTHLSRSLGRPVGTALAQHANIPGRSQTARSTTSAHTWMSKTSTRSPGGRAILGSAMATSPIQYTRRQWSSTLDSTGQHRWLHSRNPSKSNGRLHGNSAINQIEDPPYARRRCCSLHQPHTLSTSSSTCSTTTTPTKQFNNKHSGLAKQVAIASRLTSQSNASITATTRTHTTYPSRHHSRFPAADVTRAPSAAGPAHRSVSTDGSQTERSKGVELTHFSLW